MFHCIFDYNYGNFLLDFDIFYLGKQEWILYQTNCFTTIYVSNLPGKTKNNTKSADH